MRAQILQFNFTVPIATSLHIPRRSAAEARILSSREHSLPFYSVAALCPLTADPAALVHFKCAVPSRRCRHLRGDWNKLLIRTQQNETMLVFVFMVKLWPFVFCLNAISYLSNKECRIKVRFWNGRNRKWDSAVGIATGYGLDARGVGVRVPVGSRIFSSPLRPDRLWGPSSLLASYGRLFPRGYSGQAMKLTTHLPLVPRSRKRGSINPLPHTASWRSA
jgi:hypothetical protein